MHMDQSNRQTIRNFVEMSPRPQFSANDVANNTGIVLTTVRNELRLLVLQGIIVPTAKRLDRRAYYRMVSEKERELQEMQQKPAREVATAKNVSRQRVYQIMKENGIKPVRGHKITPSERNVLNTLASASLGMMSYDLHAYCQFGKLLNNGLVERVKVGRFFRYWITAKGKEAINAKS